MVVPKDQNYTAAVRRMRQELESQGWRRVALKNEWPTQSREGNKTQYRGYNTTWIDQDGNKFEMQFHTAASKKAQKASHVIYLKSRELKKTDPRKLQMIKEMEGIWENVPMPEGAAGLDDFAPGLIPRQALTSPIFAPPGFVSTFPARQLLKPVDGQPTSFSVWNVADPREGSEETRAVFRSVLEENGLESLTSKNQTRWKKGAARMSDNGMSPKLIRNFPELGEVQRDSVRGIYETDDPRIDLHPKWANPRTAIHEYGHHVEYEFFGVGDRPATLTKTGKKLWNDSIKEYKAAREHAGKLIGLVPMQREGIMKNPDGPGLVRGILKGPKNRVSPGDQLDYSEMFIQNKLWDNAEDLRAPSPYALSDPREWFAEGWAEYYNTADRTFGHDDMEQETPALFKLMDRLSEGDIVK